jgi:putative PIN family toxin of toxin-antitoxin system
MARQCGIIYDTNMKVPQIVVDTNVLVAALRSRRGASHRLLRLIDCGKFEINVSVPLVLEYEAAAKGLLHETALTAQNIDDIIDYLCAVANRRHVYYLWRPFSRDPKDDMVLELAVAASCEVIVTFNKRDFRGAESFGIGVLTPEEFLRTIGELK